MIAARGCPTIIDRHEPDARTNTETTLIVHEAERGHCIADLLRDALRLLARAMLEDDRKLIAARRAAYRAPDGIANNLPTCCSNWSPIACPHESFTFELIDVDVTTRVRCDLGRLLQNPA